MPNLSGRFPISYPGPTAALVPWQDHFSDQAQSIADILNGYQLPLAVDDAADRSAKFPSPAAGDRIYRLDTKMEQVYRDGVWKNHPNRFVGALVKKSASTAVATGPAAMIWSTTGATIDTDSLYSTGANTRFTIPFAGVWEIDWAVFTNSAGTIITISELRIGGSASGWKATPDSGVIGKGAGTSGSVRLSLSAADYIEIFNTTTSPAGNWATDSYFQARYLGEI